MKITFIAIFGSLRRASLFATIGIIGPAMLFAQIQEQPREATFALHDGDRVVFFGDSITAQRLYTTYLETAVRARYPDWKIRSTTQVWEGTASAVVLAAPSI